MHEFVITIDDDGSLQYINHPDLAGLAEEGDAINIRRASHVLPVNRVLRAVFRWLRDRFGETGPIASFTRHWPCEWQADLAPSAGPVLGPFDRRQDAIDAEVRWLNEYL